ncbi:hypothetical protein CLIB1444_11S00430 [[Candida] jaroonii]|uniref:Uncharacterized protein n=1 Tax=[Candida] jaroonii TaxID=467808 RepID=A0ACA9YCV7_9ASCO|nr:hypothetical protein CLIB1444_11S00430 [[Candida] jaroonii]
MSAYLFIVAHQNGAYQMNNTRKGKSSRQSIRSSGKSSKNDDTKSISTKSTKSSQSSGHHTSKKRFDLNTSNYVDVSEYEQIIARYEKKFNGLINECVFHETNENLNRFHGTDGDLLFNEKNINILRYSFYKKVTGDYNEILKDMKAKKVDGKTPKLRYMRKLKQFRRASSRSVSGLPNLSTDNLTIVDTFAEEANDSEVSSDEEVEHSRQDDEEFDYDELDNLYNQYSNMDKPVGIKDLIKSNQFWNNVYQDLKYNLMEISANLNYFELLPNINQLLTFYREIIDYFLINLQDLHCNTSSAKNLSDLESEKLRNYRFYYLKDFNYEWFKIMSNLHYKFFKNQSILNNTLNILQDEDLTIHRKLVGRIISTIIENFKISMGYQMQSLNSVFKLWEDFLNFLMNEIVFKFYESYDDLNIMNHISLPEPNLDNNTSTSNSTLSRTKSINSLYSSINHSSNSLVDTMNITSPEIDQSSLCSDNELDLNIQKITRNTKNLQINTFNSSLSPISRIDEEEDMDFNYSNNEYNYKRGGFVIEPPTPRYGEFELQTPVSTTFSVNSTETNKSHTSKRSIFSRLRKSKK